MHKKYYLVLLSLGEINILIPECSVMIMQGDLRHLSLVAFTIKQFSGLLKRQCCACVSQYNSCLQSLEWPVPHLLH